MCIYKVVVVGNSIVPVPVVDNKGPGICNHQKFTISNSQPF
jgi:hypothetical protein